MLVMSFINYIRVTKPRETSLLVFIGCAGAILSSNAQITLSNLLFILGVVLLGSGGANALTNYMDRNVDAKMKRTANRVLPAGLIADPARALRWALFLLTLSLGITLWVQPLAFAVGFICVVAATIGRKTWLTHFMGSISSLGPFAVAWLLVDTDIGLSFLLFCLLIMIWVPVHVWNLMLFCKDDYLAAEVNIFPLNFGETRTVKITCFLCLILYAIGVLVYIFGQLGLIYLVSFHVASVPLISANILLIAKPTKEMSRYLFKLSAFPFLGILFLGSILDLYLI